MTAMIVADEVADLYLRDPKLLVHPQYIEKAYPELEKRIKDAYRHPTVTRRRLALALVDIKFEKVLGPLLNPDRLVGLDDATLWSRRLHRDYDRLIQLRPAPSVRELLSWSKAKRREDDVADWFLRWWGELVFLPLEPFAVEMAGDEMWPPIVWEALHS